MITYQDLLEAPVKADFCKRAISEYKTSTDYNIANDAMRYFKQQNVTIMNYRKLLYKITGEAVPDNFSANHKCASNFFFRFITQENQYLLGNGVSFSEDKTKKVLGKDFDNKLQEAGRLALICGVSYGFFNLDKVDVFSALEFVPLWDEEDGSLKAGIRFWRIAENKPLRFTLYELDGYTEYISDANGTRSLSEKRAYIQIVGTSKKDGTEIIDGKNYDGFPIVPLWGNAQKQSEIVGMRENIDCYDLIKSGFANDLDDASMIYWTLTNCGGMDDIDLVKFKERMKTIGVANFPNGDDGARAEPHTTDIPYQSRETYLNRLEKDLYSDAMALNVRDLSAGANTATAINAAYEDLNVKCDMFEYCVIDFIHGLLKLKGIEDEPTFTRSKIINQTEEIERLLMSTEYLTDEFITKKICEILGCTDESEEIIKNRQVEEVDRYRNREEVDENIQDGNNGNTERIERRIEESR